VTAAANLSAGCFLWSELFLLHFRVSKAYLASNGPGCVTAVVHRNKARTPATTSRLERLGEIVVNAEL
jgi:hypothetical protein